MDRSNRDEILRVLGLGVEFSVYFGELDERVLGWVEGEAKSSLIGEEELEERSRMRSRLERTDSTEKSVDEAVYENFDALLSSAHLRHLQNPTRDGNTSLQTVHRLHQPSRNFFQIFSCAIDHQ